MASLPIFFPLFSFSSFLIFVFHFSIHVIFFVSFLMPSVDVFSVVCLSLRGSGENLPDSMCRARELYRLTHRVDDGWWFGGSLFF